MNPELTSPVGLKLKSSIQILFTHLQRSVATPSDHEGFPGLSKSLVTQLHNLFSFMLGECDHAPCVKVKKGYRDEQPWTSCAGRGLGECRQVGEGEEMMACGRVSRVLFFLLGSLSLPLVLSNAPTYSPSDVRCLSSSFQCKQVRYCSPGPSSLHLSRVVARITNRRVSPSLFLPFVPQNTKRPTGNNTRRHAGRRSGERLRPPVGMGSGKRGKEV